MKIAVALAHGCFLHYHIAATVITLGVTLKCHYCGLLELWNRMYST